jgi:hypothetical protein
MSYLNSVIGNNVSEYSVAGVQRVALAAKSNIATLTKSPTGGSITAISMTGATKFYEVKFIPNTASVSDVYTIAGTNKFMKQSVTFSVAGEDDETIAAGKQIHLGRFYSVLVQRANGKWYLLGDSAGLNCSASTANAGAGEGDDANRTFTLEGTNLGHAPLVLADVATLIEDGI